MAPSWRKKLSDDYIKECVLHYTISWKCYDNSNRTLHSSKRNTIVLCLLGTQTAWFCLISNPSYSSSKTKRHFPARKFCRYQAIFKTHRHSKHWYERKGEAQKRQGIYWENPRGVTHESGSGRWHFLGREESGKSQSRRHGCNIAPPQKKGKRKQDGWVVRRN